MTREELEVIAREFYPHAHESIIKAFVTGAIYMQENKND